MVLNPACTFHWKPTLGSNTVKLKLFGSVCFCFMSYCLEQHNAFWTDEERSLQDIAYNLIPQHAFLGILIYLSLVSGVRYIQNTIILSGWLVKIWHGSNYALHC